MGIRGRSLRIIIIGLLIVTASPVRMKTADSTVVVPGGSVIEVDDARVKGVVAMFERTEQAVRVHDLETVMAAYSPQYHYHGLKKDDIRQVWKDLFDEYKEIASTHLFTKFTHVGSGSKAVLEVTCTGHLWAVSKLSGLYIPIDSWHEEVHYLVTEDGQWRIRGNAGESPRVLPFGTAPHPMF